MAFLSVNLDDDARAVAQAVADRGYPWTQAMMGSPTNLSQLTATLDVTSLPAICLVDPAGHVIARNLTTERLHAALQRALPEKQGAHL